MKESVLVYFSVSDNHYNQLIEVLGDIMDVVFETIMFQEKNDFLNFLNAMTDKNNEEIIVVDIDSANTEMLDLLNKVHQLSPKSIKLVVSENSQLLKIQHEFHHLDSIYYINRKMEKDDLLVAVNNARICYSGRHKIFTNDIESSDSSEQYEDNKDVKPKETSKSNYIKDKFFSIIAHDLKTPFASLIGLTDILIKDWIELDDNEKLDLVKSLKSSSENTYILLDNLLIWSKSHMNKLDVIRETIHIREIIHSAVEINKSFASQKEVTINNHIREDIEVIADKNMISTVCRNLISNAVRHIPVGGKVDLLAKEDKNSVTVCVADNGGGIEKEHVLDLFKPENVGVPADTSKINTLGLVLCKEFVERNNGQIWLETAKNKGSKFYFKLPKNSS